MVNNCEKCEAHDAETKQLITQLFSPDELSLLTIVLSQSVAMQTRAANEIRLGGKDHESEVKRVAFMRRDIDFAGQLLGKIVIGFDDLYKKGLQKSLKRVGIELDVTHAGCPHADTHAVTESSAETEFVPATNNPECAPLQRN